MSSSEAETTAASARPGMRVVILQSSLKEAATLAGFFNRRHDQVWQTTRVAEARSLVQRHKAELLVLDLHLPGNDWLDLLRAVRQDHPQARVIITNRFPDLRREMLAREQGVQVFLRQPFTRQWIERALARLGDTPGARTAALPPTGPAAARLPAVRTPVRWKITLPYIILGLAFVLGAAYLVSRYVLDSFEERFTRQLIDVGRLTGDAMVHKENRLLATLRLVAHTEGVAEAVAAGDAEALRRLVYPLAVNAQEEVVEVLDVTGTSVLSLRREAGAPVEAFTATRGDSLYAAWPFVADVLAGRIDPQGDKYAGLVRAPWGDYFYVSGPILTEAGRMAGVVLVGISTQTLVREMREATLAQVTIYELGGAPLASTLLAESSGFPLAPEAAIAALARQDEGSLVRDLRTGSVDYSEIIGPWEARNGQDLGLIGAALARNALQSPTTVTRLQAFVFVTMAFIVIVTLGVYLASRITRPLTQMVHASTQVAQGNLEVKVDTYGDDEVAVLAHAFNYMITGLQEGFIYRDLLGRTVSPEVREQLRHSFASGNLRLEGQNVVATVLISDIRGFTSLAEKEAPTTVLAWLNEYFGELVPLITANGGVVDKFEGDALLTFFGILPRPLQPKESAAAACRAAAALLERIEQINARRTANGQPPFVTGIGINTGLVTAGGLGTSDRLNYTIIGDTVNTAQRLESFTREFGASGVVVSEHTYAALEERASEFDFEPLGAQVFRGKAEETRVYRLRGLAAQAGRSPAVIQPERV